MSKETEIFENITIEFYKFYHWLWSKWSVKRVKRFILCVVTDFVLSQRTGTVEPNENFIALKPKL